MISQSATLTSKGQITIPAKIIKSANLKKGQKIYFRFDGERIYFESATDFIHRIAGSLTLPKEYQDINPDILIQQAKEEHFSNYKP